ncbi:hypothetical protein ElyMa_000076300 [Elysia marginata]|uniref:Uncharacterized protein n=1 Tax=Elysia marginata TaxID=1093978 RepID=A0AAV4EH14_9GAST|nr:hypothetical protein ElyMa_000076300 [Elysia marginata]
MATVWVFGSALCMLVILLALSTSQAFVTHRSRSSRLTVPLSSRLGYRDRMFDRLGGYRRNRGGFLDIGLSNYNSYYDSRNRFNNYNYGDRFYDDNRFFYNDNRHLGRLSRNFGRRGFDLF